MTDTTRLDDLEFKVAHLEDTVQRLSELVFEQRQQLDALLERQHQLLEQVEQLDGRGQERVPHEKPPHY